NTINVLDFSGPSTPAAYEWATYGGNDRRTSVYREPEDLGVGVDPDAPTAMVFALGQNAPNPFSGSTAIRFALPEKAPVSLRVYDVSGRLVRTLVNAPLDAGRHAVTWDGRDDRGRTAASGVYFYRLSSDARELTRKALRLR
ncbi:MAG: T9SS type A sorting domain-containing protein, partial [Gemmatimonadetes bacterium]|nr:T9SS type A sorting domain-containing protein [Gemmatimonadota bacterium]